MTNQHCSSPAILLIGLLIGSLSIILSGCQHSSKNMEDTKNKTSSAQLIQAIVEEAQIPAFAYVIINNNKIMDMKAIGTTVHQGEQPVTLDSAFHIGSNTKSFTALLAGIGVDRGLLNWESNIGDELSEIFSEIPQPYKTITLRQLLSHSSGVPSIPPNKQWLGYFSSHAPSPEQRKQMITDTFTLDIRFDPGTKSEYSNMGVVIAATMIERAFGTNWEDLVVQLIFTPLSIDSGGFGPPALDKGVEEPWGHREKAISPQSIYADNPRGLNPAGRIHMSIRDSAQYAQLWLNNGTPLVSKEVFEEITSVHMDNYALGWIRIEQDPHYILTHDGSNSNFYSRFTLIPDEGFGLVLLANKGDLTQVFDKIQQIIISDYR
ncbi:serine hydrolase domain-containing protein [Spirochaeta cellobiosiphila]|uniref:serine hydrolase domain-containing protein n=1 Tax=Spirochaeta cellobiosiphila TaxID=504483 RepID=UPI00041AE629|nr:serine hydrolase domain-containing protein [Spirochaeta cellobiosiphila]